MDFLEKLTDNPATDLYWNIPEAKQGIINIVGGHAQSFRTPVKTAEYLVAHYPVRAVRTVLPSALRPQLPPADNLIFLDSTDAGSFADSAQLSSAIAAADFTILVGDLSRNSITTKAIGDAVATTPKPLLITRDAVEAALSTHPDQALMRPNLIWFAALPQLQKLLRAIYYPKVLTLTQPLVQIADTLHKLTLSYPCKIITLVDANLLVVENGRVLAIPLEQSGFSPFTLWGGELAARIAAMNLYNPGQFLNATTAAIFPQNSTP